MRKPSYNRITTFTAFPPATARRQFKVSIFIDGNNWFHRLRELLNNSIDPLQQKIKPPPNFQLRPFCENLIAPDTLISITYYKGIVKRIPNDLRSEKMYADEQRTFKFIKDNQKIDLSYGKVIQHPDGTFHEKGVDLRLAIDMLKGAINNTYEMAYLFSSDNDLHPAIEECRQLGKTIVYVGSSLKPSFGLQKICNRTILLQQKDILPFMPSTIDPNQTTLRT